MNHCCILHTSAVGQLLERYCPAKNSPQYLGLHCIISLSTPSNSSGWCLKLVEASFIAGGFKALLVGVFLYSCIWHALLLEFLVQFDQVSVLYIHVDLPLACLVRKYKVSFASLSSSIVKTFMWTALPISFPIHLSEVFLILFYLHAAWCWCFNFFTHSSNTLTGLHGL